MIPFSERIPIKDAKAKDNKKVVIAGYVHEIRALGKMSFISLRDWTGRIQVLAKKNEVGDEIFAKVNLNKEDVIIVEGTVKKNTVAPDGVEIILSNIDVLSKVENKLPVDPTGITPTDIDVRLDYRFIDLRSPNVNTIFRAKSIMANAFREYALENGFVEIHPTSLAGAATEGGTDIFEVEYFEKKVYLVQSPQFYKQMAVIGGLEKVFMTTPVFRAEKHNTIHHLNEIIQMDCEIGFADDKMAIDYLIGAFSHVINSAYNYDKARELNPELKEIKKIKTYTYTEIIDLLNENNMKIKWGDDFSREHEKKIYEILNEDSYVISEYPTAIRAFYSCSQGTGQE
ncbi:MAG: OB-fold nucleic acid binding domain-containing protein [Candidatus Micrarchaeota archaeon]|nr:OB-fold nucleic acid binding domain-containing protein [Candidatus Micrarchaeota archaeon]